MIRPSRFFRNEAGQAAVEFALVFPMFVALCFGIFEAGRALWIRTTLQEVAADAARCYAVDATTCSSSAAVQTYAVAQRKGISLSSSQVSATIDSCGRRVVITYAFESVVTEYVPWDLTMTADACFPYSSS